MDRGREPDRNGDGQFLRKAAEYLRAAPAESLTFLRPRLNRRRLLIVVAGTLVCGYAFAVLGYVLSLPDIGLRCAFTTHIMRADGEALRYPGWQEDDHHKKVEKAEGLLGDRIVKLGSHEVKTWPDYLRALTRLRDEKPGEKATFTGPIEALPPNPGLTHIMLNDEELVKVQFLDNRGEGPIGGVWCRVGSVPFETLAPSLLWFCLKAGLFLVGALVFWKRPEDRSAAQFFLLCIFTFGAFMGGYHWSRIVTQPALLLV